jgi:hypothetical protein
MGFFSINEDSEFRLGRLFSVLFGLVPKLKSPSGFDWEGRRSSVCKVADDVLPPFMGKVSVRRGGPGLVPND